VQALCSSPARGPVLQFETSASVPGLGPINEILVRPPRIASRPHLPAANRGVSSLLASDLKDAAI
jgi:hypothetical protein